MASAFWLPPHPLLPPSFLPLTTFLDALVTPSLHRLHFTNASNACLALFVVELYLDGKESVVSGDLLPALPRRVSQVQS